MAVEGQSTWSLFGEKHSDSEPSRFAERGDPFLAGRRNLTPTKPSFAQSLDVYFLISE